MKNRLNRTIRLGAVAIAGFGLAACQAEKHTMVEPAPGTPIVCQECYTRIERVRAEYGRHWGIYSGGDRVIERHQCPDCKTELSIYAEEGTLMVKCDRCAPEGLACDKCLPPEGTAK